ncbi:MAG: hypothetical protein U5N85_00170 [Arcicella sp.]|nr:hypothetical protein [Arcicella sp.]
MPATICEGGTATLSATCVTGTVTWYTAATGGVGTTGSTFTTPALLANTSYYARL